MLRHSATPHLIGLSALLTGGELIALLRTNTEPTLDWTLVLSVSFLIFFSAMTIAGALVQMLMKPLRDRLRHLILASFSGALLMGALWLTGFSLMPMFGFTIIPLDGWSSEVRPELIFLFVGTIGGGLLLYWYHRRHTDIPTRFWYLHFLFYTILAFELVYPNARTDRTAILHLFTVLALPPLASLITHARKVPIWAGVVCGLVGIFGLTALPNNAALIAGERTSVIFHAQYLTAGFRAPLSADLACLDNKNTAETDLPEVRGVLFIVVDTLRWDVLDRPSPNNDELTPTLNKLKRDALFFPNSYAVFPTTEGFSKAIGSGHEDAISGELLGTTLQAHDVPFYILAAHPNVRKHLGATVQLASLQLDGFDHRFDLSSEIVTNISVRALSELTGRFVFLAHFYDPHDFYVSNPLFYFGASELARYHAEVAWTDHHLARLLASVPEDIAILIVSDHGEEFRDHGYVKHGNRVYDESSRLLTILKHPKMEPKTLQNMVSSIDFGATILALLGIELPEGMRGIPLGAAVTERCVLVRGEARVGVVTREQKRIWNERSRTFECYDRQNDPAESVNLCR